MRRRGSLAVGVDPANPVFGNSRKPLAAEFAYRGRPRFLVGNHFASKGGDDPLFVRKILDIDPRAHVLVLGDVNDFDFSETLHVLERGADDAASSW